MVITDDYCPGTVSIKADSEPDSETDNTWTIKKLHPSSKWGKIKVTVKVPKSTWEADIKGSVSGIGYSSVHRVLPNNHPSYGIANLVTLSYESIKKTLSITTTIKPVDGATIEMYNSSSRHPSNDWLEGCNDDPNNQIVDENDTQTEPGGWTIQ